MAVNQSIEVIFDDTDEFGYVYTVGRPEYQPEILVRQCPRSSIEQITRMLNFLNDRDISPEETICFGDLYMIASEPHVCKEYLDQNFTCKINLERLIIELYPYVDKDSLTSLIQEELLDHGSQGSPSLSHCKHKKTMNSSLLGHGCRDWAHHVLAAQKN
jgi:hypothetical protein